MSVEFKHKPYDLLQRSMSTSEALEELGTSTEEAAFEAAESVVSEENYEMNDYGYLIEKVISKGPPISTKLVVKYFKQEDVSGIEEVLELLLTSVVAAATYTEMSGDSANDLLQSRDPKSEYHTQPEKILDFFIEQVEEKTSNLDNKKEVEKTVKEVLKEYDEQASQLSFTTIVVVCDYITEEYDISADLNPIIKGVETGNLNEAGRLLLLLFLVNYITEKA